MKRTKIIDTIEWEESIQDKKKNKAKNEIQNFLKDIMTEFKTTFTEMQNHCDRIETLIQIMNNQPDGNNQNPNQISQLLQKFYHPDSNIQDPKVPKTTSDPNNQPIRNNPKLTLEIFKKFKKIKKRNEENPISSLKSIDSLSFKITLMKIYIKAISSTLRILKPKKKDSDVNRWHETRFYENTIKYGDSILAIKDIFKGGNRNMMRFRKCFKKNEFMIKNFQLFLYEFFGCSIQEIIMKFRFKCCDRLEHSEECRKLWHELRDWSFIVITGKKDFRG